MEKLKERWEQAYAEFWSRFNKCFSYGKTFVRAQEYVSGLMAGIERKNGWQIAEFIGDKAPYAIQNFLSRAIWNEDLAREQIRSIACSCLLEENERGVLIIDETGFVKKGEHSAGVKRQYSGTAGRIENSQIGVFLALSGSRGQALVDRELYLPKEWCADKERREAVGIPAERIFQTKHELALAMLGRAFDQGMKPQWVLADALYGSSYDFRKFFLDWGQAYVLAVNSQQCITHELNHVKVKEFVKKLPDDAWQMVSAGAGTKGERWYEWAFTKLCWPASEGMSQYFLVRRNMKNPEELAYYLCHAAENITLSELAAAAGRRWHIESCFEQAKQEVGLDEYEVRSFRGWYRHITMSMVGLLLLNIFKGLGNSALEGKKRRSGENEHK